MESPEKKTIPAQAALEALRQGNRALAHRLALKSALQNPKQEEAWLVLAAISPPHLSVGFIQKALQANPQSQRARQAMHWAVQRLRAQPHNPAITSSPQEAAQQRSQPHPQKTQRFWTVAQYVFGRAANSLIILLGIILLAMLGLFLSRQGRLGLPVDLPSALMAAGRQTLQYLGNHPTAYIWHKEQVPALELVSHLFLNSAGLLLAALSFGALVGGLLGVLAAVGRRRIFSSLVLLITIPGISTPSFLLAMLFWVINIQLSRAAGVNKAFLPATGFGWDLHLALPAIVLAARPLAQIMQITYVNLSEALSKEFIQVARARGASWRLALFRHALPNILIPVLATLGASLRFSLASLPVVESFFLWPGIGSAILQAISLDIPELIVDLIVSLGGLFLLVNLALDLLYLVIDPRLRKDNQAEQTEEETGWGEQWGSTREKLAGWLNGIANGFSHLFHKKQLAEPSPIFLAQHKDSVARCTAEDDTQPVSVAAVAVENTAAPASDRRFILRKAVTNPLLLASSLIVFFLVGLALFGDKLITASPYQTNNIVMINGKVAAPPFAPSLEFPWGSDVVGRDIQALVLAGAKQTLSLALFATLARLGLGVLLGMIAGWQQNGWADRLIQSLISILAAFPVTIFAMILILALGIQKGLSVFIIALCLVGWGEISQYIRGVVIAQKPMLYVEAARSIGARSRDILHRHILPHLVPAALVLAILEMGSVLMLLAELGFLNIFLGGGYSVTIGETGAMQPVSYFFSDVPEWGALLANIRNWWRSYPWLAWYPGIFFFVSILAFNLWGEAMRRFIEESRLNISRLINRYTLLASVVILAITVWAFRTAAPLQIYSAQARQFNVQNVLADIETLSSPEFRGRESGRPGSKEAADYLARRMEEIGLFPAGQNHTFIREQKVRYPHLTRAPRFELLDKRGKIAAVFEYRRDFTEYVSQGAYFGTIQGAVVGVAVGANTGQLTGAPVSIRQQDIENRVVLVHKANLKQINLPYAAGMLIISEDETFLSIRNLYPSSSLRWTSTYPILEITPQTADALLKTANSSLEQFNQLAASLSPDEIAFTDPGQQVRIVLQGMQEETDTIYDVIGFIPGNAGTANPVTGQKLDAQVILISAYYDGRGQDPGGVIYPAANDNASGVAMMLEIARLLIEGNYKADKTIVFAAWGEGERGKSFSVTNTMGAKIGFSDLTVEAVIELSGVGAGDGKEIAIGQGSSYRLVSLFQEAARKTGVPLTTRGRGPHFGNLTRPDFGGRTALSAYVSWNGSDRLAHTTQDTFDIIDPEKIRKTGETTALVVTVLARETEY
ncbi:MAG: ABC transporter permease subunit [Anaerolineae bacterium]|nr:ABC transporter permease subunit [Anaerolineae bacterium]